jgi:arginyl-tRNA synthetase
MLKQELAKCLEEAVLKAQREGALPAVPLPEVVLEHPQDPGHGDFATGLPLKLARAMKMSPMAIAEKLCRHLALPAEIDRVAVAPPGFINLTLSDGWLSGQVQSVLDAGGSYGDIDLGGGKKVQLEFVSVNPTGPLHVGARPGCGPGQYPGKRARCLRLLGGEGVLCK